MFLYLSTFLITVFLGKNLVKSEAAPIVTTKLGTIIGTAKEVDVFGKQMKVDRYLGIPYAEPPVNDLRFKKTVPKTTLDSHFNATKFGKTCSQMLLFPLPESKEITIGEDCLTLNIYVPVGTNGNQGNLAVMIWLHGGGFVCGNSEAYIADTLSAQGNVIVVTINYRLSIWGFLSTEDEHAPGNYGLWDQHTAMKWVHDNIEDFGGDAAKMTIFGESAGAASVVYQSLYEGNKGLFQRAIAQSGSISNMWSTCKQPKSDAKLFGELVGCETKDSKALVECLRNKSPDIINATLNDFSNGLARMDMPFLPTVDGVFVKESPLDLLTGDSEVSVHGREVFASLDFLSGICAEEGLLVFSPMVGIEDPETFDYNRTYFEGKLLPFMLPHVFGSEMPDMVKRMIAHEYTDWGNPEDMEKRRDKLVALYTDINFGVSLVETVRRHRSIAKDSENTYMFLFDVVPTMRLLPAPSWAKRPNHADDLGYLFFEESDGIMSFLPGRENYKPTNLDKEISKYLMTMWSNFAKTGNPNEPVSVKTYWPPYTETEQKYFHITGDSTSESVKSNLLAREFNFWRKIVPAVLKATEEKKDKDSKDYCEKDGDCPP